MTNRTRFAILAVTAPILAFTLVGGLLGRASANEDTYRYLAIFEEVVSLVTDNYVEQVEPERIMEGALWGLAEALDPESSYLAPREVELFDEGPGIHTDNIGLVLTRRYYIQVVAARDGSPADVSGLKPGDFLREIDGQPTRTMSTVRAYELLNGPAGSTSSVSVIRNNAAEPISLELTRNNTKSRSISSRFVGPGVGYLRIAEFDDTATESIASATEQLAGQGAQNLLIDLRNTASGTFKAGMAAAELFTPADTLLIRESSDSQEPVTRMGPKSSISWPIVLITNPGTAGAAELFAAVLTDTTTAESVGTRTAGRAAEQTLVNLPDGGGLLLSSSHYLTASGTSIHRTGIEPTVAVQEPTIELTQTPVVPMEDPLLDRALERVLQMTTQL